MSRHHPSSTVAYASATKQHALTRSLLRCVGEVSSVNVARGCAGACAFCHARCIPGAPEPGIVAVYTGLPQQLARELHRGIDGLPRLVLFSTASDPFIGGDALELVVLGCLSTLLTHGLNIVLSTRGEPSARILALLGAHASQVRVRIPLVSVSEPYTRAWEPGTAAPGRRLFLLQRLRNLGVAAELRIEPVIPYVTDHPQEVRRLASAIVGMGQERAVLSYLHIRPGVAAQLQRETERELADLVLGGFQPPPPEMAGHGSRRYLHLPTRQRLANLRGIQRIARDVGLVVAPCECQNPGLGGVACEAMLPPSERPDPAQLELIE